MSLEKFELNPAGVRQILLSSGARNVCVSYAKSRCPDGCEINVKNGANRVNVRIVASNDEAVQKNLDNNTLLRSISS